MYTHDSCVCYFCVYTCGGDWWSDPYWGWGGGGGYGLSTLDAYNALKIFVMCFFLSLLFWHIPFWVWLAAPAEKKSAHLRVLYRRRRCLYQSGWADREGTLWLKHLYKWSLCKTKDASAAAAAGALFLKFNPPFFFQFPLFCFLLIYLTDLLFFYGPPTVWREWHRHCVVARTHLWIRLGWRRCGRKGPFLLFLAPDRTPFITVPFTAQRSHCKAFM